MAAWADLPVEVLNLIRQRLLREDYSNFRATCRGWNFKADFNPDAYEHVKYPFLVSFFGNGVDRSYSCCRAYSAAYDKTYHVRASSRLLDAHVFCSNHGWLLLARGPRAFFYHPSTECIITLPAFEKYEYFDGYVPFQSMSFSASPTSPECVVIGVIDSKSKEDSCFCVTRRGQRSWRNYFHIPNRMMHNYIPPKLDPSNIKRIRVKPNARRLNFPKCSCTGDFLWSGSYCSLIFYKEAFYCLAQDGRLGVFHPKGKKANKMWRLFDRTKWPNMFMDDPRNQAYLVECKGELISIVVGPAGKYIRIFRFCEHTKLWQIVHSLEDQMILLSSTGCIAITCDDVKLKGLANTIHFPRFDDQNRHVFYSISTGLFHSLRGDYISNELYDTKLLLQSAWVIPTFSVSYGSHPHWSSKLQQPWIAHKASSLHVAIHPHYVIRNLTFLPPPYNRTAYLSGRMVTQEARAGQACFVFTDGEDKDLLVNLGNEPIINHWRDVELATRIGRKEVVRSAYGMLVLYYNQTCSLLDPVSMTETTLPTWEFESLFVNNIVLHLPPGDASKWLVVAFGSIGRNDRLEEGEVEDEEDVALVWVEGDDTWAVHKIPGNQEINPACGVVVHQGNIYVLAPTRLVMVELRPEICSIRPMKGISFPYSSIPGNATYITKLVESCGELLLFVRYYQSYIVAREIEVDEIPIEIRVFKMDWEMMKWRLMDNLGDQAFFWCQWSCYPCCASKSGFQKNSIYMLQNNGLELYVYDYGDHTISVSLPCPNVDDYPTAEFFMWYK